MEAQKQQQQQILRRAAGTTRAAVAKKRSYSSFADGSASNESASSLHASSKLARLGLASTFDATQAWSQGPWLTLLSAAQVPPFGTTRLKTCAQHVRRYAQQIGKVENLLVVITDVDRGSSHAISATDARVTLADPTGTVYGTINKKLMEPNSRASGTGRAGALSGQIAVGAALELRDVSLISPVPGKYYLNIAKLENVPRLVSANTPAPDVNVATEGTDGEEMSDPRAAYDPAMLEEAAGERQRNAVRTHKAVETHTSLGMTYNTGSDSARDVATLPQLSGRTAAGGNPAAVCSSASAIAAFRKPRPSGPAHVSAGSSATSAAQMTGFQRNTAPVASTSNNNPDSHATSTGSEWGKRPVIDGQAWGGGAGAKPSVRHPLRGAGRGWGGASVDGIGFGSATTVQSSMRSPANSGFSATATPARPGVGTSSDGSRMSNNHSGLSSASSGSSTGWGQRPQQSPTGGSSVTGSWGQRGNQPVVAWQGSAGANTVGATPRNARSSQHAVTPVPSPTFSQPALASEPSGPTGSTLTAEQRMRVEANKARAMERRQKRLAAQAAGQQQLVGGHCARKPS